MQQRFDVRRFARPAWEWIDKMWKENVLPLLSDFVNDLPRLLIWFFKATLFYIVSLGTLAILRINWSFAKQIALITTLSLLVIDFINLREHFQLWKRLSRNWWRWSEDWPLNSMIIFVKALPLLGLWLLVAYSVYNLLENATGQPAALIGTLVTTLVGFGIQQWKMLSSAEERRERDFRDARDEIEQWRQSLQNDFSQGARRYLKLSTQKGAIWKKERIRSELDEAWQSTAPAELRDAVALLACIDNADRFGRIAHKMEESQPAHVLEWTLENLDDDWRQKVWPGFLLLSLRYRSYIDGRRLLQAQLRQWIQILRHWPQVSLWHGFPPILDTCLARGLNYLGLGIPPFSNAVAESDPILLKTRITPSWWKDIRLPETALYLGKQGTGKTATALWMTRESLVAEIPVFPVYWRGTPAQLEFEALTKALVHTLLYYLAVNPKSFLKSPIGRKVSISNVLDRYFAPRLEYHFHRAGVPEAGEGAQMMQEIERLAQSAPADAPLLENEILTLLRQARPQPFDATLMLLDLQSTPKDPHEWGKRISTWCNRLENAGVFIKVFMPILQASATTILTESLDIPCYDLTFSPVNLGAILEQRLQHSGESELLNWCDSVIRPSLPDLDAWIVHAAQGRPGRMFRLGNDLIRRIGHKQALLTREDLVDILGSPPEEKNAA